MKVTELLNRYKLKTRQAFYDRVKSLGIVLPKDARGHSYATPEQIKLLDQLHDYLRTPGTTLSGFVPVSEIGVVQVVDTPLDTSNGASITPSSEKNLEYPDKVNSLELLEQLVGAIAANIQVQSPLWHQEELEKAAVGGWLLSTAEVKQLIGVKPYSKKDSNIYERGSWQFIKVGKIGGATAWKVQKINSGSLTTSDE